MESIKTAAGRTILALSLVSILVVGGCGGGGGASASGSSSGGSGTGGSGSGTGGSGAGGSGSGGTLSGASITVNWPARSRDALTSPASALSMEVVFKAASPGGLDVKVDADRDPTKSGAYVGTYPLPSSIVKSAVQMTVNFYAQPARQGSVVGTAAATVQGSGSSLSLGTVDVTDLVKSVSVIGTVAVNPKAGPTQLTFQATDTKKNILVLTPGSATWSLVGGAAATITSDGVLTPKAKGSVTVKVTVDGMSTTQVVNVSPYAGNPYTSVPIPMPANVVYAAQAYLNNNGDVAAVGYDHYPDETTATTRDYFYWSYTDAGGPITMSTAVEGYGKFVTQLDGLDDSGDAFGATFGNGVDGDKTEVMHVGINDIKDIFPQLVSSVISHNRISAVAPNGQLLGSTDTPAGAGSGIYNYFWASSKSSAPITAPSPSFENGAIEEVSMNNSGQFVGGDGCFSSYAAQPTILAQPTVPGTYISTNAEKINSSGQILATVSYYPLQGTGTASAVYLYSGPNDTNPKHLVPPAGYGYMAAIDMNDSGLALGTITTDDGTATIKWFIADSTGVYPFVPDLTDTVPAQYGVTPLAINNSGLILGAALDQERVLFFAKLKP